MLAPMTLLVVFVLGVCLLAGIAIILRSARNGKPAGLCSKCGATIRPLSRYCGHCGAKLGANDAS